MSPIHLMEKNQDQVFKRLKARHWRAVNPPTNAIASATSTAFGSFSHPVTSLKTRRSTNKKRQGEAEAKLRDFLEEKHLFNMSSQNRNLWYKLQDDNGEKRNATMQHQTAGGPGSGLLADTPIEWQLSPQQMLTTEVTDKSHRRLSMTKAQKQRKAYSKQ